MFNDFKGKLADLSANGLPLTVTKGMLEYLIKKKSGEHDIKVEITSNYLILHGTAEIKKMMIKKSIPFTITLKPIHFENRTILFQLVKMKPLNMGFINNRLFDKPPILEYANRIIKIDFDGLDIVRKVPLGNIKSYMFVDGAIKLKISI